MHHAYGCASFIDGPHRPWLPAPERGGSVLQNASCFQDSADRCDIAVAAPKILGGRLSQEHLGLFDTPPGRRESRFALAIVGLLVAVLLAVLPFANIRLGEVDAFVPSICGIILVGELIVATLLFAQAEVFRSRALAVLASGYVLTALLLIPYALTFPGAFSPSGLLHPGLNTTAWLMIFRRWAAPCCALLYVWLKRADSASGPRPDRAAPNVLLWVAAAVTAAAALTLLTTVGHPLLPPIFINRREVIYPNLMLANLSMIAPLLVAMALLLRRESVLDVWLLVSLATMLIQTLINIPLHARFSLGSYFILLLTLLSHVVMLLALIAESNRLYVRMALAMAARSRERDARMMSMDAVAAAIAHEVGPPLTAASLSASAGLSWLTRPEPEPEKAIRSVRDTIDATQRAFDVLRSIRATFGKEKNALSEFDLNDLVRESTSLLDREMAAQKVSVRLALNETLPPILANRVQIQRVLVNLLTNAIEALAASGRRARRIAIRSAALDDETLQIEVSDSGEGIAPERMARIFEPFFTTKSWGTGLGLSLSRSIVEGHGGRLWASAVEDGGATFHLELPLKPSPEMRPVR